ncbi:MAG: hypothetical protein H8D97_00640 [Proteobacteria bacterium]|nr:hypothetical protein [Pseudomonadota bacterium]
MLYDPNEELPFYVGKGKGKRVNDSKVISKYNNPYKNNVINAILNRGYDVEIELIGWDLVEEEAFRLEIESIEYFGLRMNNTGCLTNMTYGGEGAPSGENHPFFGKRGRDSLHWGRILTKEHRSKISKSNTGKVHSEETLIKLSKTKIGTLNPMYGKIGEMCLNFGRIVTKETRNKIKKTLGNPISIDGIEYITMKDAAVSLRMSPNTIRDRLNNSKYKNYYFIKK